MTYPFLGGNFSHQRTLWSIKMIETSLSGRLMPQTTRISKPSAHPLFVLPPCRLASVPIPVPIPLTSSNAQLQKHATLSAGSMAGIAIGALAGIVMLAGLIFCVKKYRSAARSPAYPKLQELPSGLGGKKPHELHES